MEGVRRKMDYEQFKKYQLAESIEKILDCLVYINFEELPEYRKNELIEGLKILKNLMIT